MAKFIIELEDEAVNGLYKAKGFNTLVFDEYGIKKLTQYKEDEIDDIVVGDEVIFGFDRGIVTKIEGFNYWLILDDGTFLETDDIEEWKKTGRHVDLGKLWEVEE